MNNENILRLSSPMPPSVNHYLAYRAIVKNGRPICTSYCTTESKKYKKYFSEYVAAEVERQGWNLEPNKSQHFYVDAVFYFHQIDMDANNYWKVMLDAITDTKLIWLDDNVVCERVQGIYYNALNPRVELTIKPVDYIGVFDNAEQLNIFTENNCIGCTRYKRNCSIRRSALEGRVQDSVTGTECSSVRRKKETGRKEENDE